MNPPVPVPDPAPVVVSVGPVVEDEDPVVPPPHASHSSLVPSAYVIVV